MDETKKPQTIAEEAGLPDNWVPIDVPPIVPGRSEMAQNDGAQRFLQGSLPPGYQHDASFVGTEVKTAHAPNLSLMPLGIQGNPTTNAAIQSTSTKSVPAPTPAVDDVEVVNHNTQTGTAYTVQLSDRDTLVSMTNNAGGTVTLPGPGVPGGTLVQSTQNNSSVHSQTIGVNLKAGNLLVLFVSMENPGGVVYPTISDSLGNTFHQIVKEGNGSFGNVTAMVIAYNILGGADVITITNPTPGKNIFVTTLFEIGGVPSTNPLDQFSGSVSGAATITTVQQNTVALGYIYGDTGPIVPTPIAGPGWTLEETVPGFTVAEYRNNVPSALLLSATTTNAFTTGQSSVVANFMTQGTADTSLPAGFFVWIENTGSGSFVVQSNAQIDGSAQTVTLAQNQGCLFVFDGFNWWTSRGIGSAVDVDFYQTVQAAGVDKPQEAKLNFLSPFTVTDNPGNNSTDIGLSGGSSALVKINGAIVSLDKKFYMNGVSDGAAVWAVKINGVSDGG